MSARAVPAVPPALEARPRRPRLRSGLVRRERLVRRLADAPGVPLALLVAPAGYGKTTLLAEWAEADPRPFAWLTLYERDNDPGRLLGAIVERLHELEPLPGDVRDALAAPRPAIATAVLPALVRALEARRRPFVLVLDDVDALHAPASLGALHVIAAHLGPGSVLALASRTEPALALARLRAEDAVVELRTHDLAMRDGEATLLLERAGIELGPKRAAAILRRAEGWPAMLQLAVRSLREQGEAGVAMPRFAGDDRLAADYVRDELLSALDPDELAFMMRAAPLEPLSGPLCDAALGRSGCGRMLCDLARANVLLIPLDRAEERFRYHPLLGEMLRAELHRVDPLGEAEAHRRASAWHERGGDVERAIDHAIAAGDVERAEALMWPVVPAYVASGREATISRWLDRLGDEQVAARPPLALAGAATPLIRGDGDVVERLTGVAERALAHDVPAPGRSPAAAGGSLAAAAAVMRAAVARAGVAQMGEDAARAYALASDDDGWRSFACLLEGVARHLQGEQELARARLEEGVRLGGPALPTVELLCLAQLALLAFEQDGHRHGAALASRARDRAERAGLDGDPACALVFATAAVADAHAGTAESARRDATRARRLLLAAGTRVVPWYDAEVRIALARAELRLSDAVAARALLAEASGALRQVPDAIALRSWIDEAWARADAFAVGAVCGTSMLTTAELRVLRFLPSHFSFREIAARLHVSANTIKTQAHAVYFKLDVSSRSEAVARARAVGLVDGWPQALE